jgi:hypothetical protein
LFRLLLSQWKSSWFPLATVGEYLKNNHFIRIELTNYHKIEELIYYITDNRTPRQQAFSQKGVQAPWDAPRTKNGCLWTPKFGGERKLFSIISLSILIYLKRNSFNSHYYYTFDILINLMVYLAECRSFK